MTHQTLDQLIAAYNPPKDMSPRFSVCAPIDGVFAEPLRDFRSRDDALSWARRQRAHGVECRTYDWERDHNNQIIDGGEA